MGTPDFAAVSLAALINGGKSVTAVYTQPDRPKNRGHRIEACPVKTLAVQKGIPVYQPIAFGEVEIAQLKELKPDLIIAVAYGKLLPKEVLEIPAMGCINIHGSVLPSYRGSAPIQWTIINGEPFAGVTAMFMGEKLDSGDIIEVKTTPVLPGETSGELFSRLVPIGAELLETVVNRFSHEKVIGIPQNEEEISYAPPLSKQMSPVNWSLSASRIVNLIHGLNPWPSATAELAGITFKLHKAEVIDSKNDKVPGTILSADNQGIVVEAGEGAVRIIELQAAGGKKMKASDYLRGHPICL